MRSPFAQLRALLTAAALVAPAVVAHAQEPRPAPALPELVGQAARDGLADSALPVRVGERAAAGGAWRWIEGLDLRLEAFENGAEDGDVALGVHYDLVKSFGPVEIDEGAPEVELVARGNVAFTEDANPQDFLWTGLHLRWSRARPLPGAAATRGEVARDLLDPSAEELAALDAERAARLSAKADRGEPADELREDPDFRALTGRYLEGAARDLPPELLWDLELHGGLESTQDFSDRQVVLGGSFGSRLVSWDPDARLSRWNAFDVPGAALRWLAGDGFRPSGAAYPSLIGGLDVVDASRDGTRGALTEDENFLRFHAGAQLETAVVEVDDEELFLHAAWRFYQELDAPADVRRADTDASSLVELRLDLPRNWSLSYTAGELPLDSRYDSTFALGFDVRL